MFSTFFEFRRTLLITLGSIALVATPHASAQNAPASNSAPIKLIVPFSPGTGIDLIARTVGPKLALKLNRAVVVENRVGASGNIGTEDLVYMLERAGFETGYDISALIATSRWMAEILGKPPAASVSRAGLFPG